MRSQTFTIKEFMNDSYSHSTIMELSRRKIRTQLKNKVKFIIKVVIISGIIYFFLIKPIPAY